MLQNSDKWLLTVELAFFMYKQKYNIKINIGHFQIYWDCKNVSIFMKKLHIPFGPTKPKCRLCKHLQTHLSHYIMKEGYKFCSGQCSKMNPALTARHPLTLYHLAMSTPRKKDPIVPSLTFFMIL